MNKIWDLINSNDTQFFFSDILLKKKTTSFVDGILKIYCFYGGTMTHLIQFCRRQVTFWTDFSAGTSLYGTALTLPIVNWCHLR